MTQIDYNQLDGSPTVARRGVGVGTRIALVGLGVVLVAALIWLNWPREPVSRDLRSDGEENFNPPAFRPPALNEAPQAADGTTDQIVGPPPAADQSGMSQEDVARSPIMTLQAPHSPAPQPKCAPVIPSCVRNTSISDRSGSASISVSAPLRRN